MRTRLYFAGVAVAIGLVGTARSDSAMPPSVSTPVTQLKYVNTGISDGVHGELSVAAAYGDATHGAYGSFLKIPAGFVSRLHIHTGSYWAAVISGVVSNGPPGSKDVALPAGSYWFQAGGEPHVTKCLSPNECIVFISQNTKFDYVITDSGK